METKSKIISGTYHAKKIRESIKATPGAKPHLAIVLVGDDPASKIYIAHKEKACNEVGIGFSLHALPATATQEAVLALIHELNQDPGTHGILVQQPLPLHINTMAVVTAVLPTKDVDCLHPYNLGLVAAGEGKVLPGTPAGIITMLKEENIPIAGKQAVVLGRSNIVGKPMALMLLRENATVTICHSQTQNLQEICARADILVVAIGKAKYITADYVKPGAVVIDVGTNRTPDGVCGDVDFEAVEEKAAYITPVPGGVGPMTIATLLQNCMRVNEGNFS